MKRIVASIALLLALQAAAAVSTGAAAAATRADADPPHADAQALIDAGQAAEALSLLKGWLRKNPKDAEAHLLRSTALFITGKTQEGIDELDKALSLDPDLRQGWLNRGALALAEGNFPRALDAFEQAERIDPRADDNAINIGAVLLLQGDLSAATARFRRYLELNPGSAEAYYLVASNYGMTGFVQPAIQALGYAIQIDEKSRRRARVDPNFSDVARDERFKQLLETDGYQPPAGALIASSEFNSAFTGPDSRILRAVIRALEITGESFDRQIEVADSWALIWAGRFRLKVSRLELATTKVELTAPPASHEPDAWRAIGDAYFRAVTVELLKVAKSGPPGRPPSD